MDQEAFFICSHFSFNLGLKENRSQETEQNGRRNSRGCRLQSSAQNSHGPRRVDFFHYTLGQAESKTGQGDRRSRSRELHKRLIPSQASQNRTGYHEDDHNSGRSELCPL